VPTFQLKRQPVKLDQFEVLISELGVAASILDVLEHILRSQGGGSCAPDSVRTLMNEARHKLRNVREALEGEPGTESQ
jgi:hypothetical protein